jgi:hypothetical protein
MKLDEALHQLTIATKAKRLFSLWPMIEEKVAAGVSHAEILRRLNECGFELSERTYQSYLYRFRKRRRASGHQHEAVHVTETPKPRSAGVAQAFEPAALAEGEMQPRPPTFDYDPRGIDPNLLK